MVSAFKAPSRRTATMPLDLLRLKTASGAQLIPPSRRKVVANHREAPEAPEPPPPFNLPVIPAETVPVFPGLVPASVTKLP